jgi:flagellar hook-basal body complex protein FliE
MAIPTLIVTPGTAAKAYSDVANGTAGASGADFGGVLARAISGVIDTTKAAEQQAMRAIAGTGNLTDVVSAVAKAELALQTTVAIRDRVVQAYQDIMRMPI